MDENPPRQPHEIPAATVVVFRHAQEGGPPELLMQVRSHALRFAGGAAVFPGGRIDPADYELAEQVAPELPQEEGAARIAAIRETLEETGLVIGIVGPVDGRIASEARAMLLAEGKLQPLLQRFGWSLDLAALIPFARWFPRNETLTRVFDTRFYLHDLGTGAVDVDVDGTENTRLFWTSARNALALAGRGEIGLIFPTLRNLERLALFDSFAEARAQTEAIPVRTIVPRKELREGAEWLTIPGDFGYPVTGQPMASLRRG